MNFAEVDFIALPLMHSAGLAPEEARCRYELMMSLPANSPILFAQMSRFVELQRQRLQFAELGPQLERFAPRVAPTQRPGVQLDAAEAYRAAGDSDNDLRVLSSVPPVYLTGETQNRYFQLLLEKQPQQLVQIASSWSPFGEQAADFAIRNGDSGMAHAVVAARGRSRPAVWGKAYTALVGLYFTEPSVDVNGAFLNALGDQPIGERLGKLVDRNSQLAGDVWFYYGSRYGEYLGDLKRGTAEDYLPSSLEQSPASWSGYEELADYYAESGDARAAIEDYKHALELSPGQAAIHDRLALAYFRDGKRAEALAEWKLVFSGLLKQFNSGRTPESFWSDFGRVCDHLHSRHLFPSAKTDADALVRAYLHRNGNYRSNALLHSVYAAIDDPAAATAWLLDVSSSAPDSTLILSDVAGARWIPLDQRGPIFRRILEAKQNDAAKAEGLERESAQNELRSWQIRWLEYLLEAKQYRQAGDFLAALPEEPQNTDASALVSYDLQVAAHLGTLDAKIASYRFDPDHAPTAKLLRYSARELFEGGDKESARKILEFVFARELDEHQLVAANFLGLAEIRIAAGDTPGAVELLHRLVTVVGDPYADMDSAAALLEKTGHNTEAIAFLDPLVKSTPWEPEFRVRLAKAQIAAGANVSGAQESLAAIAAAPQNSYSQRIEAALSLSGSHHVAEFGGAELKLVAADAKNITLASADQPFFYDARIIAAQNSSDAHQRVQILSNALADTPARDDARVPLFHAAGALHSDEFAIASIGQMLSEEQARQVAVPDTGNETEASSTDEDFADQEGTPLNAPASLQTAQRAELAESVGVVLMRLHRFTEALGYFQTSQQLEKNPARRKELAAQISEDKALLRRQQLNAARQPILHEELEQDRLVRPRLVARSAPPAKPTAKPGERP